MKTHNRSTLIPLAAIALVFIGLATFSTNAAETIFRDDFNGSGGSPLNGTAPDVAPGAEVWSSSGLWNADGSKPSNGNGAAFLPFSPEPGKVYRISADINPDFSGSNDWIAMGFAQNNDISQPFYSGSNAAAPWVLHRENGTASQTFLGPVTAAGANHSLGLGPINLSIELSTLHANWSAAWYANGELIRNSSNTYTVNPNITHVGFGALNNANGFVDNFYVGEIGKTVPEPSTSMMVLFGGCLIVFARRLRRETHSRQRAA